MKEIFKKTFGGLSKQYYFRQMFFSVVIFGAIIALVVGSEAQLRFDSLAYFVLCFLLYPYSRFVWDSINEFIMGDNVVVLSLGYALIVKYFTITICFFGSIFIAPFGLLYLYYHHSKASSS